LAQLDKASAYGAED